jgi:hypothetical protein
MSYVILALTIGAMFIILVGTFAYVDKHSKSSDTRPWEYED